MTDSSQTQGNKRPGEMNTPPAPHVVSTSSEGSIPADKKSEVITEKFLTVAKEKNNLESIIMSQNDIIKGLEKEKETLTLSLSKFSASHKSMKERLLDFDILRNMEISELKEKIEYLIADNKKLISEKDSIFRNLERDQQNISRVDSQVVESLMREKRDLKTDKAHVEVNLQQKVDDYSREIAELKTDIDELTSAIESRIHVIDELNTKVVRLSGELSHKDSELHEKIPALLEKINSLSQSIDMKMEENSLFSKELFDLNVKISTLNEEMIEKDELLIDISEDYKKQKDEIEALHGAHELTLKNLVYERDLLKREGEDLRVGTVSQTQALEKERQEKKDLNNRLLDAMTANKKLEDDTAALQEQISSLSQELLEKNELLAAMSAAEQQTLGKDLDIEGLRKEIVRYQARLEGATAEHASNLTALREKIALMNQQLLEKNELLTVMTSEREHEKNEFLYQTDSLRKERMRLDEEMNRLIEQGLEKGKNIAEYISLLDVSQKEKAGLEADLAEAAEKINELVLEQDRMASHISRKEQALSDARAEINVLQANASILRASQAELEKRITEKREISGLASAEKEELQKTALEYHETFERLKQEIIMLNRNLAEKEQTISLMVSEKDGLAGNISELRSKLRASKSADQEVSSPVFKRREETLPARIAKKTPASKSSLVYTLPALFLLGGIGFFYAYNTGLITLPMQKPAVQEEVKKELAYNDMFSLLTKASVSDDLKFQATLLTESLVLKSDAPGEKALFDFQNYLYFKITISSPKEGLDNKTVDDPYPMITLTTGSDTVKPLSHVHSKNMKTFYRKEDPVSIMFYCVFPKTALTPDRTTLSLSFANQKGKADIAWDLKALRAGNLVP